MCTLMMLDTEIKTLFTFTIREKFYWKSSIVFKDRVESFDDYYPCNCKRRDCEINSSKYKE